MKIKLSHNIEIADVTPSQRRKIVNQFTFANPAYAEALKFGRSVYAIDQEITLYDEANAGLLLPIGSLSWLINTFNPEVIDLRASVPVPTVFNGELRPYQERFIASALSHTHGVMVAETGQVKPYRLSPWLHAYNNGRWYWSKVKTLPNNGNGRSNNSPG